MILVVLVILTTNIRNKNDYSKTKWQEVSPLLAVAPRYPVF